MSDSNDGSTSALRNSRAARNETHDGWPLPLRDQLAARLHHGSQRLLAIHARQAHAVLRDGWHRTLHAFRCAR